MKKNVEKIHSNMDRNPPDFSPSDFIDTETTAEILGIKKGTLEVWRHQGKGPEFCKFGRSVRYYKPALGKYYAQSRQVSTSQAQENEVKLMQQLKKTKAPNRVPKEM